MKALLLSLFFSALTLVAADATGNWSGTFEVKNSHGEPQTIPAYLVLKQESQKLTGTAGPKAEDQPGLLKGTVRGDELVIEIEHKGKIISLKVKIEGDAMKGDVRFEHEDETQSGVVSLKKV